MKAGGESPAPDHTSTVAGIVAEVIERVEGGAEVDLEEEIARHQEHAAALRQDLCALVRSLRTLGLAAHTSPPLPPRIGGYRLEWRVGRGGEGAAVYRAVQESTGQIVALKVLAPGTDPRQVQRFRLQMQFAALHDRHVVPVFDAGQSDGFHYLAMEFMAGGSLAAVLAALRQESGRDLMQLPQALLARMGLDAERIPTSPRDRIRREGHVRWAVAVARDVAQALEVAHGEGLIHRDVKPSNILLDAEGEPRLADFGLARRAEVSELTRSGETPGTRPYMSPEQLEGTAGVLDHRTDVYSLGVTLYELLALARPLDSESEANLIDFIRYQRPPDLRRANAAVPRDLEAVVQRCLEKEAALRFANARALAAELQRFLDGLPLSTRSVRWPTRLLRHARRRPGVAAAVVGAAAALLLLGSYLFGLGERVRFRLNRQEDQVVLARSSFRERAFEDGYRAAWMTIDESLDLLPELSNQEHIAACLCNIAEMAWRRADADAAKTVLDQLQGRGLGSSPSTRRRFLELRKDVLLATKPDEALGVLRELLSLSGLNEPARESLLVQHRLLSQLTPEEEIKLPGLIDLESRWGTERVPLVMRDGTVALWRLDDPVSEPRGRLPQAVTARLNLRVRGDGPAQPSPLPTFLVVPAKGSPPGFHCLLRVVDCLFLFSVAAAGSTVAAADHEIPADMQILRDPRKPEDDIRSFSTRLMVLEHDESGRPKRVYVATTNAAVDRTDYEVTFGAEKPVVRIADIGKCKNAHTNSVQPLSPTNDRLLLALGEWDGFGIGILERESGDWTMTRPQRIGQVCSLSPVLARSSTDLRFLLGKGSQFSAATFWSAGGRPEWEPGVYLVGLSMTRASDTKCASIAEDIDLDPSLHWRVQVAADVKLTRDDVVHVAVLHAEPRNPELRVYASAGYEDTAEPTRLEALLRMRTALLSSEPLVHRDLDGDGDDEILAYAGYWHQTDKVIATVLGRKRKP